MMKKLGFVLVAITAVCLLMLGMGLKGKINPFGISTSSKTKSDSDYDAKYRECITSEDLFQLSENKKQYIKETPKKLVKEIDQHVADYETSMESTVNSLNTIDAHNFLHDEYNRCRSLLLKNRQSKLKKYYYLKIMASCYEWDKKLNLSSEVHQVSL
ncbi:hypothetical protein [Flagellimonas allohymeniacidonis]|uniref:Uncharacterized protein n=1 Tax=Flagellimonas allohymeniacidonis TaxID=2517819 RepID=A0A4Q8QLD0_9FLAO|nr:hypothetical protein [Allomuricauda hymeniacidonis]TAI49643.1 hypothetical protein EW142_07555 [Allomuricauda hymeniacidonis]